jgi:hypothetical protein
MRIGSEVDVGGSNRQIRDGKCLSHDAFAELSPLLVAK